ncbi:hypothetical protein EVG20_g5542 [Dentipellis fragilis]|uniref:FHA domain-containing protein n=1 Tax=Dentipellis fragilis TaxID=205917 RepID=A0A4Y9YT46_9AGAM|nr:hypothetical protein EVG20_g5542 [Dentipellis fragilis]
MSVSFDQFPGPALYLYTLNDTFSPKQISLPPNGHVKIGRDGDLHSAPTKLNGLFDCLSLSRYHARVWGEAGKIFIKDMGSTNGTFVNGERLSDQGVRSEPFQLKSYDVVDFAINLPNRKGIVLYRKVSALVICVFSEEDARAAPRDQQYQEVSSFRARSFTRSQ